MPASDGKALRKRIEELRSSHWPAEDLETVSACPLCGAAQREVLHNGLWDNSALGAPGRWMLWSCGSCGAAYLDPRPSVASIGRAYESYYTHDDEAEPDVEQTGGVSIRTRLANGYRNWRYGTTSGPVSPLGALVGRVAPALRRASDARFRYLPKTAAARPKVLDVGCGGGQWLERITETRWEGYGADPDPNAVNLARAKGLDVRQGGIEAWSDHPGEFDALTLSHVIEHVHDPLKLLTDAFKLLRPGGRLYVETPNIDAIGHSLFGRSWRGLEAPRHLIIFNRPSLIALLRRAGFERIRQELAPSQLAFITAVSNELRSIDPDFADSAGAALLPDRWARLRSRYTRPRREFLTITCSRPTSDRRAGPHNR